MKMKNKKVVITGAAGGFGQEFVKIFCKMGAYVDALDYDEKALNHLKKNIADQGFDIQTFCVDVTSQKNFDTYKKSCLQSQSLPTIWINNAGIALPNSFSKMSDATFHKIMNVNFWGSVYGCKMALSLMQDRHEGIIVNIASGSGVLPAPFLTAYTASKHAVVGFTRSLQMELELAKNPLKLLLVLPGFAKTAINETNPNVTLPDWVKASPQKICQNIVKQILKQKLEIYPDSQVALFEKLYRISPNALTFLSKIFAAKNLRELLGIEGIER